MSDLRVGFSRIEINPPMGIPLAGYFIERRAEGILDSLEANAVAISLKDKTVLLMTIDHCGLPKVFLDNYKNEISKATGVPVDAIYIHSTHTHTAPTVVPDMTDPLCIEYDKTLCQNTVEVAKNAIADLMKAMFGAFAVP